MAFKKKQKGMVFHQEGAVAPTAAFAVDHPPTYFVPKPAKASKGSIEQISYATNDEPDMMGKHNIYSSRVATRTSGGLPVVKHPTSSSTHSDILPADSICKGVRVTLDNNSMWNEFYRCKTEMILTKQGSRMFPYCRFRISGLNPSRKYSLIMDILPLDNSRYKWTGKSWQVAGKAECHVKNEPFAHPESPSTGQHWMQNPVSFYKLKLTNNISDQDGNTIIHPMHRYLPRLYVVQTEKAAKDIKLKGPSVVTFTFPQTEFMAVTAYQNSQFSQLKVDYNPFAKGLKEDGSSPWGLKLKLNCGKDLHKDGDTTTNEQHPVKKSLKSLLANHKPRTSKAADPNPSFEILVTKRKLKEEKHILNSLNCKNDIKINSSKVSNVAASALAQTFSVDSGRKPNPDVPSDVNVKQLKRPVPLPLPALALFLKQHSTKSKKSLTVDAAETDYQTAECTGADIHPNEITSNVIGQADESAFQPSSLSCPNAVANTDSNGVRTESLILAERTLVLPISDQPLCAPATSPCLASSSTSPTFPPTMDTVLPAVKLPQTAAVTEGSTLSSDLPTMKPESLLSDPECSSLDFEPLSPASSLEPLPPLLASLGLDLDSGLCLKGPESLQHSKNSAISVFKWHTVLPPPEPYVDTFQPKQQPLPLPPITPSCLPCQTPSRPGEQLFCTSTPPSELAPSFQENEQSLPFPAELSPLVLQLPLSPTFSSLDGDGLSPTPSLADLVHFLSTDDDLGMGVEFPNTEAVAVPFSPPSTIEANAHEPSHQVQSNPAYKRKKKSQRHKLSKTEMHPKNDDSFYTKMQPNLEEVEEQLFISFTSKVKQKLFSSDTTETVEKRISAFEKILLRDLKLMKHRQVIHPVLQEVGLKMNLLDPTLAIDLQYLGVRLPIPPPGVSLEPLIQDLPPTQAFVSRTGKTTDVTQIKGWREKFTPSEAPSVPDKPQGKSNLSAFCSDMLDKYLEHEGKLLDERAASFSKPQVEPVVYELPTKSTSYVRTLDSILKKQPGISTNQIPKQPTNPIFKKRRKLKPKSSSQTLRPTAPTVHVSEDMAPLESDSELGDRGPMITRALLRQKDLEDRVVWEGQPRTYITEERAAIALTSLFTLMGFASENPTAPIQLVQRWAPPCLNEFCRLGCVCSSLSYCSRVSHCGRPQCMFGCSCLKQKVVLLKNLDWSDSSTSHHQNNKKRRRKRRMKMAYSKDIPALHLLSVYILSFPSAAEQVQLASSRQAPSPPSGPPPKPSKRLIILAECKWESDADRNHVLKTLCEAMAQDRLGDPFWIKKYLISPLTQTVEENGTDHCIQYKIHISTPKVEREKPPETQQKREEDKMNSMGLPFLTGISPAGFLSANKKKPGGTDHLVNGKLYPLAKIQLGKMGALHPANRLAAYLTGRVGSNKDKQVSSSSSKPPLASGLIPQTASSSSVLTSPTSTSTLPRPQLSVLTCTSSTVNNLSVALCFSDSQINTSVPPAPTTISQKIVLQPVQTALGVQYYRRPNGKLVRLVPVSQLRSGNPSLPLQRGDISLPPQHPPPPTVLPPTGSSSPSGLPAAPLQTPAITVVKETLPLTTATTTPPTTSSVSSLRSVPPPSSPLRPASAFPPQKGICTFKILPASSNKEPIIITCPKVPLQAPTKVVPVPGIFTLLQPHPKPPVNLISLTPSPGEGAGLGVKTVTVSAVPVDLGGVSVPQKPASYQTCGSSSSLWPSLSPDGQVEIVERGPTGPDQQQETRRGAGTESLKSLLNEINFLNQQTLTAVTPVSSPGRRSPEVDAEQQDHPHSPWVLQLDSDSDDAVTMETEVAGITVHQKAPTNECNDSGVLAPPPLLQMHVAGGGAVGRSTEEGVAWRPMPRLVPLGLRGNQTMSHLDSPLPAQCSHRTIKGAV
uniref:T-box domain-containing protein n=1 Tax=Anabas testudineus TaxID=64144 RepID=A0A3Q1JX18_ANATE